MATDFDGFKEEITNSTIRDKLKELYGKIENIDLFVAAVLEVSFVYIFRIQGCAGSKTFTRYNCRRAGFTVTTGGGIKGSPI